MDKILPRRRIVPKTNSVLEDYAIPGPTLGVGVNGKVKLLVCKKTGEKYALKILNDTPRARREIDLHCRCSNHANIVSIVDIYENMNTGKRCLLLIMECMEGGELFSRIEKKTHFTEREAAKIMKSIAGAVQHIHMMDIAHRDLKPENLLFVTDSETSDVKLTDFGFAKETRQVLQTPCYTPYYVAPEILNSEDKRSSTYDKSCDMWSLGVILYILLAGYPPFFAEGGGHISPGMRKRIQTGSFDFPVEEWGGVDPSVRNLIKSLLDTDPEKRLSINDMMKHPWISKCDLVPSTPLRTSHNVRFDPENIREAQLEMEQALAEMRVVTPKDKVEDEAKQVMPLSNAESGLLARRKKLQSE